FGERDMRIKVRAESERIILQGGLFRAGHSNEGRDVSICSDVQNVQRTPDQAIEAADSARIRQTEAVDVRARPADPVIPPYGRALPLHQFQETVDDCRIRTISGGVPV